MARSFVQLPPDVTEPFDVYLNGVRQRPDADFVVDGDCLIFDRALRRDRVSGWRWFVGAWGVGTYRQDDSVDVAYERDGRPWVAQGLHVFLVDD
jgi:hypothetical protein